jgi:hypothetical protein
LRHGANYKFVLNFGQKIKGWGSVCENVSRLGNNIKLDGRELGCKVEERINLAQKITFAVTDA